MTSVSTLTRTQVDMSGLMRLLAKSDDQWRKYLFY